MSADITKRLQSLREHIRREMGQRCDDETDPTVMTLWGIRDELDAILQIRVESDLQATSAREMAASSLKLQRDLCETLGLPEGTPPEEVVRVVREVASRGPRLLDVVPEMPEDNGGSSYPYWSIVDPPTVYHLEDEEPCTWEECEHRSHRPDGEGPGHMVPCAKVAPSTIACPEVGPFFTREEAEHVFKTRRYRFGPRAVIWCHSGHMSATWRKLCDAREAAKGGGRG
jgi:hypothetical protein